jgi:hypothetical protein
MLVTNRNLQHHIGTPDEFHGAAFAAWLREHRPVKAFIDHTAAAPGQGMSSMFRYGRMLKAAPAAFAVPCLEITAASALAGRGSLPTWCRRPIRAGRPVSRRFCNLNDPVRRRFRNLADRSRFAGGCLGDLFGTQDVEEASALVLGPHIVKPMTDIAAENE